MLKKNKNIFFGGSIEDNNYNILYIFLLFITIIIFFIILYKFYIYFTNPLPGSSKDVNKITTPTDNTPTDNTETDNTPTDNTPTDNTPTDNTPTNNTPTNNTPTDNTPANNITTRTTYNTTTTTTRPTTATTPTKNLLEEHYVDGVGLVASVALESILSKLFDAKLRKLLGWSAVNPKVTAKSNILKTIKALSAKGLRYITSLFKFGSSITSKLITGSTKELTLVMEAAAEQAAEAANAGKTAAAKEAAKAEAKALVKETVTKSAAMGPIGIAMLALTAVSMVLDLADTGGYNELATWTQIKESCTKEIEDLYGGTTINYPAIVGPIEALALTPGDLNDTYSVRGELDISGVIYPIPSLLDNQILHHTTNLKSSDPDYIYFMKNTVPNYVKNNKLLSNDQFDTYIETFLNSVKPNTNLSYVDFWVSKALDLICSERNGVLTPDGSCMYVKDKCKGPIGQFETGREWSNTKNLCLSINPFIEDRCRLNRMNYNIDTGICDMTVSMCRTKAGEETPKDGVPNSNSDNLNNDPLNNFVSECKIPIGIEICGAIFGTTICNGLDQIFNANQYKPCNSDQKDTGIMCMDKCKNGYEDNGAGLCVGPHTKKVGMADQCATGYTKSGGGLCYKNCETGYNFSGIDSNTKPTNYNFCVKDCGQYNMHNNGSGTCIGDCPNGYSPNAGGLLCTVKTIEKMYVPKAAPGGRQSYIPQNTTYSQWRCDNGWNWDNLHNKAVAIHDDEKGSGWDQCGMRDLLGTCWPVKIRCRRDRSACEDGYTYNAGLCNWESKCNTGDKKVGLLCERTCPDGYKERTAGIFSAAEVVTVRPPQQIPDSKANGAGVVPNCNGKDNVVGTCYEECPAGTQRIDGTDQCSFNSTIAKSTYVPNSNWKQRKIPFSKNNKNEPIPPPRTTITQQGITAQQQKDYDNQRTREMDDANAKNQAEKLRFEGEQMLRAQEERKALTAEQLAQANANPNPGGQPMVVTGMRVRRITAENGDEYYIYEDENAPIINYD